MAGTRTGIRTGTRTLKGREARGRVLRSINSFDGSAGGEDPGGPLFRQQSPWPFLAA
jgi:hypothetical protein